MSSVRKGRYPNGKAFFQAVWTVIGKDGERRQQTKVFAKLGEAKTYAGRMADEVEKRGVADPHRHTVREYLNRWLATLRQKGEEYSPTTLAGYRRCTDLICSEVGHITLAKLSAYHLDQAYGALLKSGGKSRKPNPDGSRNPCPLTARTVHHAHRCIHTALEQARKWKLIGENPARDATPPSPSPSSARAMSDDEISRVWQAALKAQAGGKAYPGIDCVVLLMMLTGLRRSEVLGLCWDAIDLDAGKIAVRRTLIVGENGRPVLRERAKTARSLRTVSIPAVLAERLRAHWAFTAEQMLAWGADYCRAPMLVFPEAGGSMPNPGTWTIRLRQIMRQARVMGVQPAHGYRHSAATALIAAGTDIKTVQTLLGHSTPAITMALYVHSEETRDKAAGDALAARLERLS